MLRTSEKEEWNFFCWLRVQRTRRKSLKRNFIKCIEMAWENIILMFIHTLNITAPKKHKSNNLHESYEKRISEWTSENKKKVMHFICAIALYRAACVCRFTPFVEPSRWIEAKQHEKMVIELWYRSTMKANTLTVLAMQLAWNFMLWILKETKADPGIDNDRSFFGSELN